MNARLTDDGQCVTVDVHGFAVQEAIAIVERLILKAKGRGRTSVRVIHGSSTTKPEGSRRTIKLEIQSLVDDGSLDVASSYFADGYTILGLPLSATQDNTLIKSYEVF